MLRLIGRDWPAYLITLDAWFRDVLMIHVSHSQGFMHSALTSKRVLHADSQILQASHCLEGKQENQEG